MDDAMTDVACIAAVLLCEACGRTFVQMNAYSNHVGSCAHRKKRMASALETAKEKYRNKKSRLEMPSTAPPLRAESLLQQLTTPVTFAVRFSFY